jgi:uncharacterized repeat protein (TIGR03803 family)
VILTGRVTAQTFTTLHNFGSSYYDGLDPETGLMVLSGNTLYGTTDSGGTNGSGMVFGININQMGVAANLYSFTGIAGYNSQEYAINSDGVGPACLTLSGNILYGTTVSGGTNGNGTIFAINTDGTGFTNVHIFSATYANGRSIYTNSDGQFPLGCMILSGNTLYGTTLQGGTNGVGTVFSVKTNGMNFTLMHTFSSGATNLVGYTTNSDGRFPEAGLILSGNTLYGTTGGGGTNASGTIFAVNTDGTGFTILHFFSTFGINSSGFYTNSEGISPFATLLLSGNTLYGTTFFGGTNGNGTVFAVNTNGSGFTTMHTFTALVSGTNTDGVHSYGELILSGNMLYGTAERGGNWGNGTIFAINTNGTSFTTLHSFTALVSGINADGALPQAGLILSGNTLYGTADTGGSFDSGTVFSLSLPLPVPVILSTPQITVGKTNFTFLLSGPAGSNYVLQISTNLLNWSPVSTSTIPVSGTISLSNAISGYKQSFYRAYLK